MSKTIKLNHPRYILQKTEEVLKKRSETPELPISTLPYLNSRLHGLQKKNLVVVGARSSMGKSAFVSQLAYDFAKHNKRVLFISLEMTAESIIERMFCNQHRVDNFRLLTGHIDEYSLSWEKFKSEVSTLPLLLTDNVGYEWGDIEYIIAQADPKPDVVIIDYIQAIKNASRNPKEVIDEYIRNLRESCIKNNYCAIICSQINRTVADSENRYPELHQLKTSGVLEELSDVCVLLYWEHFYDQNKPPEDYKIFIAKNRNGRIGELDVKYYAPFYRFEDTPKLDISPALKNIGKIFNGKPVIRKDIEE